MKQDDNTHQHICEDENEDTGESTISCNIEVDSLDHQPDVPLLDAVHHDNALQD